MATVGVAMARAPVMLACLMRIVTTTAAAREVVDLWQVRLLLRMLRADPGDARRRWFEDGSNPNPNPNPDKP